MDPRLMPFNGRVAHVSLRGSIEAERFEEGVPFRVTAPVATLWRHEHSGPRQRQLLFGDRFLAIDESGDRIFGVSQKDGYVGYVDPAALGAAAVATHMVVARSTHLYGEPDLRFPGVLPLSFGSLVRIVRTVGGFMETGNGEYLPSQHLRPVSEHSDDPVSVAEIFLGAPYLWGGNSIWGIDCSGLVQAALLACGFECPGDSDMQEAALGADLRPDDQVCRGDLFFWKGHVAMAADGETLVHANAREMAVTREPISEATRRIAAQGDGPVTSRRRLRARDA